MTENQWKIRRKLRGLEHAELSGNVSKSCRYFGGSRMRPLEYHEPRSALHCSTFRYFRAIQNP